MLALSDAKSMPENGAILPQEEPPPRLLTSNLIYLSLFRKALFCRR